MESFLDMMISRDLSVEKILVEKRVMLIEIDRFDLKMTSHESKYENPGSRRYHLMLAWVAIWDEIVKKR